MTTPLIKPCILNLFQMEIQKINLEFLKKICDLYELNFDEALNKLKNEANLKLILKHDETIKITKKRNPPLPQERCIAYVNRKDICQCLLRKSIGLFCARHFKLHSENRLKNGTVKKHV
jgi:hypothetical protein